MEGFIYYPPEGIPTSEINPKALRHKYYVQQLPGSGNLVPGLLLQDIQPEVGNWKDIAAIEGKLPARYFVQHTDFNTLVPGSLIQADVLPKGRWKEIKKLTTEVFHRLLTVDWVVNVPVIPYEVTIVTNTGFAGLILNPVLEFLWPGFTQDYPTSDLYYFKGNFEAFGNEVSKLTKFNSNGSYFRNYFYEDGTTGSLIETDPTAQIDLNILPDTPAGTYSFVIPFSRLEMGRMVTHYIFFENMLNKA